MQRRKIHTLHLSSLEVEEKTQTLFSTLRIMLQDEGVMKYSEDDPLYRHLNYSEEEALKRLRRGVN